MNTKTADRYIELGGLARIATDPDSARKQVIRILHTGLLNSSPVLQDVFLKAELSQIFRHAYEVAARDLEHRQHAIGLLCGAEHILKAYSTPERTDVARLMREAVVQALDTMTNENLEMVQMNIDYAVSIAQKLAAT